MRSLLPRTGITEASMLTALQKGPCTCAACCFCFRGVVPFYPPIHIGSGALRGLRLGIRCAACPEPCFHGSGICDAGGVGTKWSCGKHRAGASRPLRRAIVNEFLNASSQAMATQVASGVSEMQTAPMLVGDPAMFGTMPGPCAWGAQTMPAPGLWPGAMAAVGMGQMPLPAGSVPVMASSAGSTASLVTGSAVASVPVMAPHAAATPPGLLQAPVHHPGWPAPAQWGYGVPVRHVPLPHGVPVGHVPLPQGVPQDTFHFKGYLFRCQEIHLAAMDMMDAPRI